MSLNELKLFKNVKITSDYSVVHDMTPETWRQYLTGELWESNPEWNNDSPEIVFSQSVNYYRLPDTIRIEGNFDELRQATYGYLQDTGGIRTPSFGTIFFFVEDVRLLKQGSRYDSEQVGPEGQQQTFVDAVDVCELDIKVDVWSSYGGKFELYDSYVERRHMDRWKNTGTEAEPVWEPIYYPNAAQGVEGAYRQERTEIITPTQKPETSGPEYSFELILISIIKDDGKGKTVVGVNAYSTNSGLPYDVYTRQNHKYFGYSDVISGAIYTELGATADFVQSIVVLPCIGRGISIPGTVIIDPNDGHLKTTTQWTEEGTNLAYMDITEDYDEVFRSYVSKNVNVVKPDHAYAGSGETPDTTVYYDEHEPMMYYFPARQRKVITGMGGEMFTVPDIAALDSNIRIQQMYDLTGTVLVVYMKNNMMEGNAIGAIGSETCASLPIYNSAWKSYDAISKVSDTIMFNAKQMQTIGGGATSTALGGIGGFVQGGPAGAIAGIISGVVGTGLSYYGNEEELRAKQMQIKNSPCTMKSGGSGLGAVIKHLIGIFYITLKMDDQSMEKLRFMYYWYGYHVNRTFKGDINLHTRERFDFIKTSGAKVKGDLTAGAAKEIGAIFDKGVTIYHGPEGYALIGSGDMVANDEVNE